MERSDVYDIVQNPRRRALLQVLNELGGNGCLREVVFRIARMESGDNYDKKLIKSVQVSLLQTHLPKLQNAGIIDYDETTGNLRLIQIPPELRYHLEVIPKGDVSWSTYYFILSLVGFVFSIVLSNLFAIILMVCFLLTSIFQVIESRYMPSLTKKLSNRLRRKETKVNEPASIHEHQDSDED
jgi:uncharacterized membrane protein YciS (DUF1049 family)